MDNETLASLFSEFGEVTEAKVIKDFRSDRSKGFGFVSFETKEELEKAFVMDGREIEGRPLRVNAAHNKERSSGGGDRERERY